MSQFDPDNRVGAGGGAGFSQGPNGMRELRQGGNVTSRLPGRVTVGAGEGVGTTTVRDLRGQATGNSGGEWVGEAPTESYGEYYEQRNTKTGEVRRKWQGATGGGDGV